ncbi:MAG: hypothetical protein CL535_16220 [Ahrensia sp.]|nr:hypothetical protein [Ahrensia sp.]MBV48219.1 hypothetical protein [Roseobacter sp.]|tara:strand:- start:101171 stop:101419 length:249 start_codon:yes stop_codon:yes gene_type:complete
MTMIERVARAIQGAEATHENGTPWVEHVARAAIEAMREPTWKMLEDSGQVENYGDSYSDLHPDLDHKAWWRAMIDAALNEEH